VRHDVFGEIEYNADDQAWTGSCPLPVFAEYGKSDSLLSEPSPDFARGIFAFTVQDETGAGPTAPQASAFRYLREREKDICHAVMMELIEAVDMRGGWIRWLQQRRASRLWGWMARLAGPEYTAPDDLKRAVRCTSFEVSGQSVGDYAYIAFYFETIFGLEVEHGLSVLFHPKRETLSGDASAIHELIWVGQ